MSERWRIRPGQAVKLAKIDSGSTAGAPGDRTGTEADLPVLSARLSVLQDRLWAEGRRSLLVILQGPDAAGKDGTVKHVFQGLNPLATRATAFREPTAEEVAHDFIWRVHRKAPAAGEIGIFNRSHYEDVIVARVHKIVEEPVWRARYDLINAFEGLLAHGGTTVVKIYLHISPEQQLARLNDRRKVPDKRWKLKAADWQDRDRWDAFRLAYEEAISKTSTLTAPWYVVPADHKWFRNWAVSHILIDALERMDPRYPILPMARPITGTGGRP